MMIILSGIIIGLIILFLYCSLVVSSRCSREEERLYGREESKRIR